MRKCLCRRQTTLKEKLFSVPWFGFLNNAWSFWEVLLETSQSSEARSHCLAWQCRISNRSTVRNHPHTALPHYFSFLGSLLSNFILRFIWLFYFLTGYLIWNIMYSSLTFKCYFVKPKNFFLYLLRLFFVGVLYFS